MLKTLDIFIKNKPKTILKELIMMDENLKKEVESLVSQRYNDIQIKQALTSKGYTIQQIDEALRAPVAEVKKVDKKLIIAILSIIIIGGMIFLLLPKEKNIEAPIQYKPSEFAGDWISKNNNSVVINVSEATNYMSEFNYGRQTYIDDGEIITVFLNPYYEGISLRNIFEDTGKLPISVSADMKISDTVPEAFAFLKKEDNDYVIYLFADDDWKAKFGDESYIVWSDNIGNFSTISEREFVFNSNSNNIYFDKISDAGWITKNPVRGRLYFGNLRKQDIIDNNFNKTFIEVT